MKIQNNRLLAFGVLISSVGVALVALTGAANHGGSVTPDRIIHFAIGFLCGLGLTIAISAAAMRRCGAGIS